ncbi:MAG: NAD(P)-dependent alcohol dehydrogenase [Spirochaetales bacterium]|nr:NAD(P)-dependent alcohol dehydrogenase [Spirochaetales bacterium]
MKAIVSERYGSPDLFELRELPRPEPREDEVLVQIFAASVNAYDWHVQMAKPAMVRLMGGGLLRPVNSIPGADFAGRVVAVGEETKQFKPGDEVYGDVADVGAGAFAEYVCVPENAIVCKPENITFQEAAAVPMAAVTALQGLRDEGKVKPGQNVLINGASGGVGTFAVQIARWLGAEVTAVCSTAKMGKASELGAEHVIDYTKENFVTRGKRYDMILGVNGYNALSAYKKGLSAGGTYVMAGGTNSQIFQAVFLSRLMSIGGGKSMCMVSAHISQEDLILLKDLIESGAVTPVIDTVFPLEKTADAVKYVEEGHASGKVIIEVVSPA